ncbi:MAG: radical SAM protein [Candidatus Omnitrophota bacterium]
MPQKALCLRPQAAYNCLNNDINVTAEILSDQNANIIFEMNKRIGRWVFRRSGIEVETPHLINNTLGSKMEQVGQKAILLTLRSQSTTQITHALKDVLLRDRPIAESFAEYGIKSSFEFKKVLLVPPYGDYLGRPLKYVRPHYGIETVAFRLNREVENVDAYVYNPNLGSREELYSLVKQENFDIIAFSILISLLEKNLEIILKIHNLAPDSIIVFGGYELPHLSPEVLKNFSSLPCDVYARDDGTSLVEIAKTYHKGQRHLLSKQLGAIPNIAVRSDRGLILTEETKIPEGRYDVISDIPTDRADLTHGRAYELLLKGMSNVPVPMDQIGRSPLSIFYGNRCRGRCIFCDLKKNTTMPPPARSIIDLMQRLSGTYDSINFECSDLLFDHESLREFIAALRNSPFASIPKKGPARVDSVGNGVILREMAQVGFQIISFGIESFNTDVLRKIGKGTTREQNIRALELTLSAGIRPGINLMLFTPWDTIDSTMDTIEQALSFAEQGAYININRRIDIGYGMAISKMEDVVEYKTINLPGMSQELQVIHVGKVLDEELKVLLPEFFEIEKGLIESYLSPDKSSISVHSLLSFKAFYLTYAKAYGYTPELERRIARVDRIIEQTIAYNKQTILTGNVAALKYSGYRNIAVPQSDSASSLKMEDYIATKFPEELLKEIKQHKHRVEIHRGPQNATEKYIAYLQDEGYEVTVLRPKEPRIRNYYRARKGDECVFIISNSIGYNRELFIVQILQYYQYPEKQVFLRVFPCDLRRHLLRQLGKFAGKIEKVIIAHDVDDVADMLVNKIDPGARIVETITSDFMHAKVIEASNQQIVLMYEIEYTNGEQIKPVLEFFADAASERGLGVNEIVLYAACGGIGNQVAVNDLLLFSNAYKYDERVSSSLSNAAHGVELSMFIPGDISVHKADIFTIPTVLSSSTELIDDIANKTEVAGIELELAHAIEALEKYPGIIFRAIHEVHDKPAGTYEHGKKQTIGDSVPGLKDKDKHTAVTEGILKYLHCLWELENRFRNDAQKAGFSCGILPKIFFTLDTIRPDLLQAVEQKYGENAIIAIGGVSGTGKTQKISKEIAKIIQDEIYQEVCIIPGDNFALPKDKQDTKLAYPSNLFNLRMMTTVMKDAKIGKRIGFPIYDLAIRATPCLSNMEITELKKGYPQTVKLSYYSEPVILLGSSGNKYRGMLKYNDSKLAVDTTTGEIIELINPNKKNFIFEVTLALLLPELRDLYDFSIFVWAGSETRRHNLRRNKKTGQRYLHYTYEEIDRRFLRMQKEEDPTVFPTAEYADAILINEHRTPLLEIEDVEKISRDAHSQKPILPKSLEITSAIHSAA